MLWPHRDGEEYETIEQGTIDEMANVVERLARELRSIRHEQMVERVRTGRVSINAARMEMGVPPTHDRVKTTKGPSRTGMVVNRRSDGRLLVEWDDGLPSGCSDQVVRPIGDTPQINASQDA